MTLQNVERTPTIFSVRFQSSWSYPSKSSQELSYLDPSTIAKYLVSLNKKERNFCNCLKTANLVPCSLHNNNQVAKIKSGSDCKVIEVAIIIHNYNKNKYNLVWWHWHDVAPYNMVIYKLKRSCDVSLTNLTPYPRTFHLTQPHPQCPHIRKRKQSNLTVMPGTTTN